MVTGRYSFCQGVKTYGSPSFGVISGGVGARFITPRVGRLHHHPTGWRAKLIIRFFHTDLEPVTTIILSGATTVAINADEYRHHLCIFIRAWKRLLLTDRCLYSTCCRPGRHSTP